MALESLLAGKWIAGRDINDAIRRVTGINRNGCWAIVNYLGEELTAKREIDEAVEQYINLISAIKAEGLRADISLKASQIGLSISRDIAAENYSKIVERARQNGIFVWLDMESSSTVSSTIWLYESQVKSGNVGIAIQSYLKRSMDDVNRLIEEGGIIRLVKGAYKESPDIAYITWEERTQNYRRIMNLLFEKSSEFTIATHDLDIVKEAISLNEKYGRNMTIAMLLGIRNSYAYEFAKSGAKCSIYVPYGSKWVDYARRRLREASNVRLILSSIIGK